LVLTIKGAGDSLLFGFSPFPSLPPAKNSLSLFPMIKGQKVVCVNDSFPEFVRAIYKQLPVKDNIYTIREVFLGREKIVKGGDSATVGLLLEELHNPPDPFHKGEQELGFSSERFAPLEELPAEEEEEEIAGVLTGAWAN
jgi:hypothetical protein